MKNLRSLFATRKKAIITSMSIIIILIIFGAGIAYATSTIAESTSIGAENAKNFAFADAGVDPVTAQDVSAEFDFKNGQFVYEVEFTADDTEYDYLIKSSDGTVVKKEMKVLCIDNTTTDSTTEQSTTDSTTNSSSSSSTTKSNTTSSSNSSSSNTSSNTTSSSSNTTSNSSSSKSNTASSSSSNTSSSNSTSSSSSSSSSMISLATAKSKALADANVSSSAVTYTKAKLDYDDGVAVYEIEFYTSTYEYEYEINAYTGAIYEKSVEAIKNSSSSTTSSSSYIGVDKAKSIAVEKVGFTVSEVTFKKAKLEEDDGIYVYEIEFYKDGLEYDFTINATTGNIIEYDIDYDD